MSVDVCHIVQISRDESLFKGDKDDEPVNRQVDYGRILSAIETNAVITMVVLTSDKSYEPFVIDNVRFIPVAGVLRGRLRIWRVLKKIHRELPISLITTQTVYDEAWIAQVFCRFYHCRIVGQIHSELFSPAALTGIFGKGIIAKLRWKMTCYMLRYFHGVRTVNVETERVLRRKNLNHNVVAIPVRTQWSVFDGDVTSKRKEVIIVARLSVEKNVQDFIYIAEAVLSQDSEVRFCIVGDGPERNRLEALVSDMGLENSIHFKGQVKNHDLGDIYRSASVCLVTSKYEGFGRVLIESYVSGTPVVAYKAAGPNEIILDKETGYLHEQGDIDGMADSILNLLSDPSHARQMAVKGKLLVQNKYCPERISRMWVKFWVDNII